jgi:hypothetical protein
MEKIKENKRGSKAYMYLGMNKQRRKSTVKISTIISSRNKENVARNYKTRTRN